MSESAEDENNGTKTKSRKINRACDACRRKKTRCDGPTAESNVCSNCTQYDIECTYVEAAKKRGPPKKYVEALESRLNNMEALLKSLCPGADFTRELGSHMSREMWFTREKYKRYGANGIGSDNLDQHSSPVLGQSSKQVISDEPGASDDDFPPRVAEDEWQPQAGASTDPHYYGRSSGSDLSKTVDSMKREYAVGDFTYIDPRTDPTFEGRSVPAPNEVERVDFEFPPQDLMESLIPHYFFHYNLYLPVLHRPTFDRQYRDGLHHRDMGFASVLLLVCAIAARSFDDPRVLREEGETSDDLQNSAGWKYYSQLKMHRKSLTTSLVTLYDLQQYTLAAIFLRGSTVPYGSWVMVGIGLRIAQDIGAHRKRSSSGPMTVQDELWKRVVWILVNLDRIGSSTLGRPCALHDEDFDLDMPLEVDDEYWENPNPSKLFKQPAHIPSTVAYFKAAIELDQILSFALRTIYSVDKTKILTRFGSKPWEQAIVTEIHSKLDSWIASLPGHLKWTPTQEDIVFFQQSALLHATYYHIHILVHRPFIPSPRKPAKLSYPSLTICTNAARSMSSVLDALRRKCGAGPAPPLMNYAFTSGLVVLLDIWGMNKPGGAAVDISVAMQDVHMCMEYLAVADARWPLAGRLRSMLFELASVGEIPLPLSSPETKDQRERDSHSANSAPSQEHVVPPKPALHSRVPEGRSSPQLTVASSDFLALNSVDLERMPRYHSFHPQEQPLQLPVATAPDDTAVSGMSWYSNTQPLPNANAGYQEPTTYAAPLLEVYGPAAHADRAPQMAPAHHMGEFDTHFPPQMFHGSVQLDMEQNCSWEGTLDMWSTAPTGFLWEDWNKFTTNMPNFAQVGTRPDGQSHTGV